MRGLGPEARLGDETWEGPVLAQVAGIAVDDATMASVVATLGSNKQPVAITEDGSIVRSASWRWSMLAACSATPRAWRA